MVTACPSPERQRRAQHPPLTLRAWTKCFLRGSSIIIRRYLRRGIRILSGVLGKDQDRKRLRSWSFLFIHAVLVPGEPAV